MDRISDNFRNFDELLKNGLTTQNKKVCRERSVPSVESLSHNSCCMHGYPNWNMNTLIFYLAFAWENHNKGSKT